jgi:hypothetical protein
MIKIVISQDEIQGHCNRVLHFTKKLLKARRFRDITADKDRIRLGILNRRIKGGSPTRLKEVQMDVRCPGHSHSVHTLAKSKEIRMMVSP